jgi:hypothetical protein
MIVGVASEENLAALDALAYSLGSRAAPDVR